ncbi:PAS domain S-box protein [Pantanalinema sp. GBBB05]|uniref:PAS domain S-box protein n=1 Tax=Pantanalinema sp. GBBB05 TaxID=2604139 RepID=UPI001DB7BC8F|nr:PAS domain S-box protein [Pantanalinema sp. GBBB05]
MKRPRRSAHPVNQARFCACHPHPRTKPPHSDDPNQPTLVQPQTEPECDRFFALSSDILSIVGFDGYFKRLSAAAETILGFSQAELLAHPFLEFVHPDDRTATIAVVQRLAMGERINHFENRYRCQGGDYKWLDWSGIAVLEEERIYCTARDITAHKQLEHDLQESAARFQAFMQYSPIAAWIVDASGRILDVNPRWAELMQLSAEAAIGQTLFDILPAELAQSYFDNNTWVLQSNQMIECMESAPLADGSLGDYLVYKFPIARPDGCCLIGGVAVDITKLKRTEAALRDSEARYRLLASHFPNGAVHLFDRDLRYVLVDGTGLELVGLSKAEMEGRTIWEVLPPETCDFVEPFYQAALEGEASVVEVSFVNQVYLVHYLPIQSGDEHLAAGMVVAHNITERKRAEAALRLANFSFDRSALATIWVDHNAQILQANAGTSQMLGYSREELQAKFVYELNPTIPQESWSEHWQTLQQQKTLTFLSQLQKKDGSLVPVEITLNYLEFDGNQYGFAYAVDISDRLQAEATRRYQRQQEQIVVSITQQIRQSLDLAEILDGTVTAVRAFLNSDRVLIYRLEAEIGGSVIAESVEPGWISTSGMIINDCHFTETYAQLYQQGRVQAVDDIDAANLTPCHVNLLAQLQVRANLAVPIVQEDRLWGLLVVQQCRAPRHWQSLEVDLLKQLAAQVAIAIQQSELYEQAQAEIARRQLAEAALRQQSDHERLIADITNRLRQSLDLDDVLSVTVAEVREVLGADRVLIFQLHADGSGSIVKEAVLPEYPVTKEMRWVDECFPTECYEFYQQGNTRIVPNISTDDWGACLAQFMQSIGVKSKVVAPILQTCEESGKTQVWGLLIAHACAEPRAWQPIEADLLQHITHKLAIAIQQAELHQQVQQLNTTLEIQVQERTSELQQALKFEALLKRITDKVRDSLDEAQILQTAVQELALDLQVQCCDTALYDFEQEASIIQCEYIIADIPAARGLTFSFSHLPEVYAQLLQGQYVLFSPIAAPGCWRTGTAPRTILICPVLDDQGVLGDIWLFRPPEESFMAAEIRLVEQVANQCAIALRQSRLYQASQAQVTELQRLNQLKDDFLSTVSHELRTPMSNIKMAIQMLEVTQPQVTKADPDLDRTSRYFDILRHECQREIGLINDLLDLTRLEAGTDPLNLTTIDLPTWIAHVLEPFEHRTCSQQQQLQLCTPGALPITTDLSYLERILTELLNNACKYTPAGGQISVSIEIDPKGEEQQDAGQASASVLITVCNSGVEIPSHELERIFDKFYRIPNHDPWKHGGTGLGLALVKRLVATINGKIAASSFNQQTTFTIWLPYLNQESPVALMPRPKLLDRDNC